MLRSVILKTRSSSKAVRLSKSIGSATEQAFPRLEIPFEIKDTSACQRSEDAANSYLKTLFTCQSGGGEKGVHKHVVVNKKMLVRDRIRHILDDNSDFFELCPTAGMDLDYGDVPGAGTVTGVGMVRGNLVMVIAPDGSLKGGTSYPITVTKSLRAQEVAMENRIPCLYVVDSGGAFLPLQSEIFPDVKHGGRSFRNQAVMSGLGIPQVAIVAGPCTAGGAYTPTMSDEAIMVNRIGHVFLGGPPLVKAATGEVVTHEDLGGARLHTSVSGVADYFASDETESFKLVRDVISGLNMMPAQDFNVLINPPLCNVDDLVYYGGLSVLVKDDMKAIIARIVDDSRFLEFKEPFGQNLIVGFSKICCQTVGICANAGKLSGSDGQKGAHFLQLCEGRNIPVVFLQNAGAQRESDESYTYETLKETAKFAHSCANLSVPKISINCGGLGGVHDLVSMCGPSFSARFNLSWPRARYSKQDLTSASDPIECSAQYAASRCTIDSVILPQETRMALAKALQISMYDNSGWPQKRIDQQNSILRI